MMSASDGKRREAFSFGTKNQRRLQMAKGKHKGLVIKGGHHMEKHGGKNKMGGKKKKGSKRKR
jgi:hypothetical protein